MKNLRAGIRCFCIIVLSVVVMFLFCTGLPVCRFKEGGRIRWKNLLISRWAILVSKLIGLQIQLKGRPPDPPFFLVSNHLGYLDILPYWGYLKTTFVAKNEIRNWPFFGITASLLGILFLNRTRIRDLARVNTRIAQRISEYQGMIVFPEGTSSKGEEVLPFKSSLLYYPSLMEMPVHYASISYQISDSEPHEAWNEVCWWGDMDFVSHFWNLLKIKSFTATIHFGNSMIKNTNRKRLAEALHRAVNNNFVTTFDD